jgi:hypothetical protein
MNRRHFLAGGLALLASRALPQAQARVGTITGRLLLNGTPPGNAIIRMGMDPKCADLNRASRPLQESALVGADGGIANAFIRLIGTFPATPVPAAPIVVGQHACFYTPRVIGMRVGQTLRVRNDDALAHNVHSASAVGNSFNVAQGKAGEFFDFTPQKEEVMVKLGCDIHRWMTAYIGVVSHPYFAVSGAGGAYTIERVPAGTYEIKTWHERFGELTRTVKVSPGSVVRADFSYAPT